MLLQLLVVAVLVAAHVFAGRLRFLDGIPRSRWLSAAGGTGVAYVFLHVFPELNAAQQHFDETVPALAWIDHHVYLVALFGLAAFYGLERMVKTAQPERGTVQETGTQGETEVEQGVFWLHIASFALYNALVGYLLVHSEEQDARGLLLFAIALALHFVVNDYGLQQDHGQTYRRVGRWVLATAVVVGWGVGQMAALSVATTGVLFAFLAGGIVLNVLKEELPDERKSRFGPFATGAAFYAILLLLL